MKRLLLLLLLSVVYTTGQAQTKKTRHTIDAVPDSAAAVRVGEKLLLARFGSDIYESKPLTARLEKGIWIVSGYLPEGYFDGVPIVEFRKRDGKVLRIGMPK